MAQYNQNGRTLTSPAFTDAKKLRGRSSTPVNTAPKPIFPSATRAS
jgi:hypothetical protein